MDRDKIIEGIRPTLDLTNTNTKPLELFQNETLRPILKLQHEVTIALLKNQKNYSSELLQNCTRQQYENRISKHLQTNHDLKNKLTGMIIGLFTNSELKFYHEHRKEIKKRINQMQIKRFVDSEFSESTNDNDSSIN